MLAKHRNQFTIALVLLDRAVHRVINCPPDMPSNYLPALVADAGVDGIISDTAEPGEYRFSICFLVACISTIVPGGWMQPDVGVDPVTISEDANFPLTVGDFVRACENTPA